jgi:phosphatidate cytidylyltransferase
VVARVGQAVEEVKDAPKIDVHWRKVAAGAAMAAACAGAIVGDYFIGLDICFHVILVALTVKALYEFYAMCESSDTGPFRGFGIVSAVILVNCHWAATPGTLAWFGAPAWIAALLGEELVPLGLVVAVLGALWLQATKRDNDRTFESISSTLFGVLYVWFLASFLVKLRHLGADGRLASQGWNETGTGLLLSCVAVSKLADVGGYLFGRKFGRHKMIPRISPNKSWEGLFAGLALSIAAAYVLWVARLLPLGAAWTVAVYGLLVGGMGTLGDLAESLLKRGSGRKDTDDLVPGFGGVLDVVDSLLISAPVAYFLSILLLRVGA